MSKQDNLAWHFSTGETATYRRSLPATKIVPGLVLTHEGALVPCHAGLHYSYRAIDALEYAPGPFISRVRISDERVDHSDKGVARTREVLWGGDATTVLDHWLCNCLEKMLLDSRADGYEPEQVEWEAVEVQRRWIAGEATLEAVLVTRDRASTWALATASVTACVRARAWARAWSRAWASAQGNASVNASVRAWASVRTWALASAWHNDELERLLTEAFAPKGETT